MVIANYREWGFWGGAGVFPRDAFLRNIISVCTVRGGSGWGLSQTACQNTPLATRTLIKPTSPLSQPASALPRAEPCELSLLSPIFKPLILIRADQITVCLFN